MALTPEDVVNKRFNPTKFREGYDQDEVDDFLDEVVVELRRLNQENEELRQRLVAGEARIHELQRGGAAAAAAPSAFPEPASEPVAVEPPAPEPVVEPEPVAAVPEPVAAEPVAPVPAPEPVPAPVAEVPVVEPTEHVSDTSSTNNLLQLARRLHEEHVREGVERRDALIAEGHATAARVVAEAEAQQKAQLGALETQKAALQTEIEDLKVFEREYRTKLKDYITGQLKDLEAAPTFSDDQAPASGATPAPVEDALPTTGDFATAAAPTGAPVESGTVGDAPGRAGND